MENNIRKIKISADNMATALRIVKERYGSDAYILHEEQKDSRVHLIVATALNTTDSDGEVIDRLVADTPQITESLNHNDDILNKEISTMKIEEIPSSKKIDDLARELDSIKAYLEHYLPKLILDKYQNDSAVKSLILKQMVNNGYSMAFANEIINKLPSSVNAYNYLGMLKELLKQNINTTSLIDIIQGKKVLFVGPGGVGKTSAIIKLIKMLVARQLPDNINVVGMPSNCIAEHESLKRYAGIMNCNFIELAKATQEDMTFIGKPNTTTLFDTSQYIQNKPETIQDIKRIIKILRNQVIVVLVLSANSRTSIMDDLITSLKEQIHIDGVVLTKIDETDQMGNVIEQTIKNKLTILGFVNNEDKTKPMYLLNEDEIVIKTLEHHIKNKFTEISFFNKNELKNIGVDNAV